MATVSIGHYLTTQDKATIKTSMQWRSVLVSIHGYLMLTNIHASAWSAPILAGPQTIGRSPSNQIVIPREFSSVSRRHAQIRIDRGIILIQDLNSTGGTRLNGVNLVPKRESEVVFGDRVGLAELEMFLVAPEAKILQTLSRAGTGADADMDSGESSIILVGRSAGTSREFRRLQKLSPAESQVVCWISRGLTTPEAIGAKLFRSPHTIRTQLNSIFRKLRVHSREELLAWLLHNEIAWASAPDDDGDDSDRVLPPPATGEYETVNDGDCSDQGSIHDSDDSDLKEPVPAH